VRRGSEVKAGDVLATFTLNSDDIALPTRQLELERAIEDRESRVSAMQENIAALNEQLAVAADSFESEILSLRISRSELELEQYIYLQDRTIASLQAEIANLEATQSMDSIIAPVDGVIASVASKREGDAVSSGEVLITMYSTESMLIRVEDLSGDFRYGMDVSIEVGPTKGRTTISGHVVASDSILPDAYARGFAYIQLDPYEDDGSLRLSSPLARGNTEYLENILLIPRKAAVLEEGKYYVTLLVDGRPQKRYINHIMNTSSYSWVVQGLSEGDVVILD